MSRSSEFSARIHAILDQAVDPPPPSCPCGCLVHHPTCNNCEHVASAAEKVGAERPPVALVETRIGSMGQRVFTGLCASCEDLRWSSHWDARWMQAKADDVKRARLLEEAKQYELKGRAYRGTKRPGGPTTTAPHVATCRCASCTTARRDEEQATSLFPQGYAP